jgi:hypothetical protein
MLWLQGKEVLPLRVSVLSLIAAVAVVLAAGVSAQAKGTARIEQSDGSSQTYSDVDIRVSNKTLRLTSADGKGVLVIDRAACSYVGDILRCLPYSMTLDQGGGAHPLDFAGGTVYLNLTTDKQQMPSSSAQLPPHGILLAIQTKIGTLITLSGLMDEVSK